MSPAGLAPLAWALILSLSVLCAQDAGATQIRDDQNSFNGYVMETPLSQYPFLKALKTWSAEFVKEVGEYENPGESFTVDGVTFIKVRYRFADQRLESIMLVYEGRDNREKLVQWLEKRYGILAAGERRMINQVEWHGAKMTITLSYSFSSKTGTLWFISPELHFLLHESIASMPD